MQISVPALFSIDEYSRFYRLLIRKLFVFPLRINNVHEIFSVHGLLTFVRKKCNLITEGTI